MAVQLIRLFLRVGIRHHDRIESRAVLVIRIDAQILFDHTAAGDATCLQRRVDLGTGGFLHTKWLSLRRCKVTLTARVSTAEESFASRTVFCDGVRKRGSSSLSR